MPVEEQFLSHWNNILQKVRVATGTNADLARRVQARYEQFVNALQFPTDANQEPADAVRQLNEYVDFSKTVEAENSFFNWRSNFAASVIPEFFYRYAVSRFDRLGVAAFFSTKDSVVEATFSVNEAGAMHVRHKDQDLCVGVRKETLVCSGKTLVFVAPAVCCEVKTNIDINKLNGLDFSAERLKRSFPGARYFLITETIDFSLNNNYAAGFIDEVFVLRKQVRSVARRTKEPLCPDVFKATCDTIVETVILASRAAGHVYERLPAGKLIQFEPKRPKP